MPKYGAPARIPRGQAPLSRRFPGRSLGSGARQAAGGAGGTVNLAIPRWADLSLCGFYSVRNLM